MLRSASKLTTVIALGVASTAVAQNADIVALKDGTRTRGKVTSVSKDKIVVDEKGSTKTIATNEIDSIAFDGEPSAMRQVRELIKGGQWTAALERLERRVDTSRIKNKRIAGEVAFFKALATARKGDESAKAVKALLDYVRHNRHSHHFYESVEVLGDLAMQLGSYQKAAEYYGQLKKAPWPANKLQGAFLEATALQAQGPSQLSAALDGYDAVIKSQVSSPDAVRYKQLALAGKVACSVNAQNAETSIKTMQELIAKNDPQDTELFARAYNAMGACYQVAGKPHEAIHQYLHVSILFDRVDTAHAEALFHLSRLWQQIGNVDRAAETRKLLMSRYAGTVWAKQ